MTMYGEYYPELSDLLVDLNSSDPLIRRIAYRALLEAGEEAVAALVEEFDRISGAARLHVLRAFGEIGHPRAVPLLLEVMRSRDPQEYFMASSLAAKSLGQIGDRTAVEGLLTLLSDERTGLRRMAALVLGSIGDERAVPGLAQALHDRDRGVQRLAARALNQIGTPRAIALVEVWREGR